MQHICMPLSHDVLKGCWCRNGETNQKDVSHRVAETRVNRISSCVPKTQRYNRFPKLHAVLNVVQHCRGILLTSESGQTGGKRTYLNGKAIFDVGHQQGRFPNSYIANNHCFDSNWLIHCRTSEISRTRQCIGSANLLAARRFLLLTRIAPEPNNARHEPFANVFCNGTPQAVRRGHLVHVAAHLCQHKPFSRLQE
jgi:hypothetical protein